MIDLQIEEYCKECNDFEVEQETIALCGFDLEETVHKLKCAHREKCKALKDYLERKIEK